MRLKPSEVRIINAVRTLQPMSKIYISKHESGDLNIQTHERIQGPKPRLEAGPAPHRVQLRD